MSVYLFFTFLSVLLTIFVIESSVMEPYFMEYETNKRMIIKALFYVLALIPVLQFISASLAFYVYSKNT